MCLLGLAWASPPQVWTPLWGLYQLPSGQTPLTQGCQAQLALSQTNHLSYAGGSWGMVATDLEETRLEATFRQATPLGEFSVYLPFKVYWGGFLDPFLDGVHQVLGLPHNTETGATRLWYQPQGGEQVGLWGYATGLGDAALTWGLPLSQQVWLRAHLGVPLGTAASLTGGGGWRGGLELGGQQGDWSGSVMTLLPFGTSEAYNHLGLTTQPNWLARLRWDRVDQFLGIPGLLTSLQAELITSPLRMAGEYGGWAGEIQLLFGGGWLVFREDLGPPSPDVVFALQQDWDWPDCRLWSPG